MQQIYNIKYSESIAILIANANIQADFPRVSSTEETFSLLALRTLLIHTSVIYLLKMSNSGYTKAEY